MLSHGASNGISHQHVLSYNPNFEEYENAFVFGFSGDTGFGGSSPVVIDRRSGDALMFAYALGEGMISGAPIREGVVD